MSSAGKEITWRALLALSILAGCSRPLPEAETASAELYRQRCGSCHRAFDPRSMKYAAWEMILPRMELRMQSAGQAPLTADEKGVIEKYVRKHSG